MTGIIIQNIVASTSFETTLDLKSIHERLDETDYNPETFPGIICRLYKPKCTMLIFNNGKIVCTGAKKISDAQQSINKLGITLVKTYPDIDKNPKIKIQNIVGTFDIGSELNPTRIALGFGLDHVEYEPEQFPGLIFRMDEPKVVLLLFASGKIVVTGGKSIKDMEQAVENIRKLLTSGGFLSK